MPRKPRGFISPYRNYQFMDKDPAIDLARTAIEDSGKSYQKIHEGSNVSTTTLYNWFHGKTRRPQFATVASVLLTCGITAVNLMELRRVGVRSLKK